MFRSLTDLRRVSLLALTLAVPAGLAACGGEPIDQSRLDEVQFGDSGAAADRRDQTTTERQLEADADARAAEIARKRRQELAELEAEQRAETERLLKEGTPGGNPEDAAFPIGAADPEIERFRARLAGICDGAQKRIAEITKQAENATKSKDPARMLKSAQDYNDILNRFMNALGGLDAPPGIRSDYRAWLGTISALSDNVRLQLVSQADAKRAAELAREFQTLGTKLVEQSAGLGVICLSPTG